jgi:peptidyl-prolyl cis-trans isomerase A (cyclophilin A)
VDSNLYDQSVFFRVCDPENESDRDVPIEVIQGGWLDDRMEFEPIVIETTEKTGLQHLDGTISMARAEPNTATSSYFICINDQPELDQGGRRNPDGSGFAAFGKVLKGMDIVRQIQSQPDSAQMLLDPIMVHSIQRLP